VSELGEPSEHPHKILPDLGVLTAKRFDPLHELPRILFALFHMSLLVRWLMSGAFAIGHGACRLTVKLDTLELLVMLQEERDHSIGGHLTAVLNRVSRLGCRALKEPIRAARDDLGEAEINPMRLYARLYALLSHLLRLSHGPVLPSLPGSSLAKADAPGPAVVPVSPPKSRRPRGSIRKS